MTADDWEHAWQTCRPAVTALRAALPPFSLVIKRYGSLRESGSLREGGLHRTCSGSGHFDVIRTCLYG